MLNLIFPMLELHMQNGLKTPWEQGIEVDFHLAFGLYCNFSVKGIFRLSRKIASIFKDYWNIAFKLEMKIPKICKLFFSP